MCQIQYADPWDCYSFHRRKARKEHKCYECSRTIHKGETYHYSTGLMDGHWSTHKLCVHCEAAAGWLEVVCHGWMYGGIGEELREHWTENPGFRSIGLGRLIHGLERGWRRTRWADGLMEVPTWVKAVAEATMVPIREQERAERLADDERIRLAGAESDRRYRERMAAKAVAREASSGI